MKCTKEYRLRYTERAKEIVKGLTLEEKVSLMSGQVQLEQMIKDMTEDPNKHYNYIPYPAGGIEEKGIPAMKFCDGPRGVVCGVGQSTCFPVTMLRGATFDVELEERVGRAIGKEIRAWGGNLFGGVCINLPYNPGWGRSQETYGEDSFHLGQMGSALVRGVQSENVIACVKHYAFNSMEISRFKVNVECDKRTEREVYLPHFKDCIDAGAASVMSA
ncbi:MAG TPA: glycosyl hydrolase, partial [Firmicutes bacterium]|nr:glycosyl hydrolase [Bacillota bacterium]